jgi:hypothetical protein
MHPLVEKMRLHEGLDEMDQMSRHMLKRVLFNLIVMPCVIAFVAFAVLYLLGSFILAVVIPVAKTLW